MSNLKLILTETCLVVYDKFTILMSIQLDNHNSFSFIAYAGLDRPYRVIKDDK